MTLRQNLHTHTLFDDGGASPEEMAQAALEAGLTSLGFSGHSVLPYENDWCLTAERLPAYLAAVARTREAFAGRLAVWSGLEWDGISPQSPAGFDYVIGSLHHIAVDGRTPCIDDSAGMTSAVLSRFFGGDRDAMLRAYFAQYGALAENPAVDIVGHFDLISKFDDTDGLFDSESPAYRDSAMAALEALLRAGKIFEVNTGAMAGGRRSVPYPAPWLLRELRARRGRVLVTADAHSPQAVAYGFGQMEALLSSLGFRETWRYTESGFQPQKL